MRNLVIPAIELIDKLFCNGETTRKHSLGEAVYHGCAARISGESAEDVDTFYRYVSDNTLISLSGIWCESGFVFFKLGRYDLAIESLEKALGRQGCDQIPDDVVLAMRKALSEPKAMMATIN